MEEVEIKKTGLDKIGNGKIITIKFPEVIDFVSEINVNNEKKEVVNEHGS